MMRQFTVGDMRAAIVDAPDDAIIYIDDRTVDTPGNQRQEMLAIVKAEIGEEYALGSPDGPRARDFVITIVDSNYDLIGTQVPAPSIGTVTP